MGPICLIFANSDICHVMCSFTLLPTSWIIPVRLAQDMESYLNWKFWKIIILKQELVRHKKKCRLTGVAEILFDFKEKNTEHEYLLGITTRLK